MIYYVRHGQTDYNIKNIFAGHLDVPLNEEGFKQARKTAEELKDIKFDVCYCSPLIRAKQTCDEILKFHKGLKPIYDDRLKERFYGDMENKPVKDLNFNHWKLIDFDEQTKELRIETLSDCYKRISGFFEEILSKYDNKNILVVAHGCIGRIALSYFNGFPLDNDLSSIRIPNAGVVVFDKPIKQKTNFN